MGPTMTFCVKNNPTNFALCAFWLEVVLELWCDNIVYGDHYAQKAITVKCIQAYSCEN